MVRFYVNWGVFLLSILFALISLFISIVVPFLHGFPPNPLEITWAIIGLAIGGLGIFYGLSLKRKVRKFPREHPLNSPLSMKTKLSATLIIIFTVSFLILCAYGYYTSFAHKYGIS